MTAFQQMEYHVKLGVDYPHPIIPPSGGGGNNSHNGNGSGDQSNNNKQPQNGRQRKENTNNKNRGQKYEMKSVKTGGYHIK
jgi:hypothetical protein